MSTHRCSPSMPHAETLLVLLPLLADGIALPPMDCLSAEEHRKLDRLRCVQDRRAQAMAHLLKRLLLAEISGDQAANLQFDKTAQGKPWMRGGDPPWFNLAHSKTTVAVAVSRQGPVGVDCEEGSSWPSEEPGFESMVFTADERQVLASAADPIMARLPLWTAKEAVLKAEGWGLSREPTQIDCALGLVMGGSRPWRVHHYLLDGQAQAAIATDSASAIPVALRLDLEAVQLWVRQGHAPKPLERIPASGAPWQLMPVARSAEH